MADIRAAGLAKWGSVPPHAEAAEQPRAAASRQHYPASRVLHDVAHPFRSFKAHHKRKSEELPRDLSAKKQRAGLGPGRDDHGVPHAYQAGQSLAAPDPGKVLGVMRLGLNRLK